VKTELKEIPTLKKWNATRRLGRAICLSALCNAYPYILNHLDVEIKTSTDKKVCTQRTNFTDTLLNSFEQKHRIYMKE